MPTDNINFSGHTCDGGVRAAAVLTATKRPLRAVVQLALRRSSHAALAQPVNRLCGYARLFGDILHIDSLQPLGKLFACDHALLCDMFVQQRKPYVGHS